ncbi:MAG: RsbRD N-terminal domain-containing protein [Desulfobacteraceae bacterium]|nr:RsbRD N-terminal domain-containing protein [Desulfobacteraceae bacterium]
MNLDKLLESKKTTIVDKWFNSVIQTYAPDAAQFFKNQKDQFHNPVGTAARKSLDAVFSGLMAGLDPARLEPELDPLIRIRAVQDFSPSRAVSFLFDLKDILRSSLKKELPKENLEAQLLAFERKIDQVGLLGFEIYTRCREKILELKVSTERNKIYRAFSRAGLIAEVLEDDQDLEAS